jgi:predicted ArsR family transcriptional regulator
VTDGALVDMLARRPMTARDLAQALGMTMPQVKEMLQRLCTAGLVAQHLYKDQKFYRSHETAPAYSQDDCAGSFSSKFKGHIT